LNKQIRVVGVISGLLVFAMLANLSLITILREDTLQANDFNIRAREAEHDVHRGQILAGDLVIADSVESDDSTAFRYQRVYPYPELYASVTGFYSYVFTSTRIENSYNDYLVGSNSSQWFQHLVDTVSGRTPQGASVVTTISPTLQQAAWDALKGYQGAIIAMDPHTGAIKALVSTPSWDPNLLTTHDLDDQHENWQTLINDPRRPMADRASREYYPPGSTFKLVVAAAALEAGYTTESLVVTPSQLHLPGTDVYLPNYADCGNDKVTLVRALEKSCNTSFANLGLELGQQALRKQAQRFGFDADHVEELGSKGGSFPSNLDDAQLAMSSIGQFDVLANPLQMAMVVAAFVNDGQLAAPYLVQEVRAPDLTVLYRHKVETSTAVSASTAKAMQEMMVSVVNNGGGVAAAIPGVTVGGKSGTAENDPFGSQYAWFVGYALDPDLVVAVFLEHSEGTGDIWGAANAAPIMKEVLLAR
jgi:cell division protein FtsI/penicillin-binding protein 2